VKHNPIKGEHKGAVWKRYQTRLYLFGPSLEHAQHKKKKTGKNAPLQIIIIIEIIIIITKVIDDNEEGYLSQDGFTNWERICIKTQYISHYALHRQEYRNELKENI
jgi:hypothetical protein